MFAIDKLFDSFFAVKIDLATLERHLDPFGIIL
jgi:hypothetical protein